jgi:hypothetical protein
MSIRNDGPPMSSAPRCPLPDRLTSDQAERLLADWGHPTPARWLEFHHSELQLAGEPPSCPGERVWSRLLRDELDKLYNQAWCALEQIRAADDEETVMMLAMDDLPSAVEQAWSLSPEGAGEHLQLLRDYKEERHRDFLRQLGAGTDREAEERAECLEFWETNAELTSALRQRLYREVRATLRADPSERS